jgi:hypothetical protein
MELSKGVKFLNPDFIPLDKQIEAIEQNEKRLLTPVHGTLELLPDDALTFYQALKFLGDDWTAEEFGLNVFFGHICVFKEHYQHGDEKLISITNADDYLKTTGGAKEFTGDSSYTVSSVLLQFKYSKSLLSECKSQLLSERYISFQQAKTQISALIGESGGAEELLIHAIRHNKISPCHPFVGWLESDNQLYWDGYFQESVFDDWFTKELGETLDESELLKERQKAVAEIAASRIHDLYKSPYTEKTIEDLLKYETSSLLNPNLNKQACEDTDSKPNPYLVELYVWKRMLEVDRHKSAKERDKVRVSIIDTKLKEIEWHLNDCPPIENPAITPPREYGETAGDAGMSSQADKAPKERELTKWLRDTWELEGKPGGMAFFTKLKKYEKQNGSPIVEHYSAGKAAGFRWETSLGATGEMKKKTVLTKVSLFKKAS